MKKQVLTLALILMTLGILLITSSIASAQSSNEFAVPLSEPSKRGKLKARINYGSITVKGTGRKDILIRYKSVEDECDDCDDDHHDDDHENHKVKSKEGLKKIGGGGMDLEVVESNNFVKVQSESWNNKLN